MRIGIDARPLQDGNATRGIGAYLSSLLPELIKSSEGDEFVLITYKNKKLSIDLDYHNVLMEEVKEPERSKLQKLLKSNEPLDIAKYKLDVFMQSDFQNPVVKGKTPVVAVAYDLIPLHFKKQEFFSIPKGLSAKQQAKMRLQNIARYRKYRADLKNYSKANSIVAISQATADDFKQTLKLSQPIKVTLLAASGVGETKSKIAKPSNYLLYIGANEDRKNINFLIRAFGDLLSKHPKMRLKLVGHNFGENNNPHTKAQKALTESLGLAGSVDFVGFVDDREKSMLYQHASVFAFPSLYEGFGLPVLEAMQNGCPVVAFNNSSIPEVSGQAAILAKNERYFIDGINSIINDESKRNSLVKAGFTQARKFSWQKTAEETLKVLRVSAKEQV